MTEVIKFFGLAVMALTIVLIFFGQYLIAAICLTAYMIALIYFVNRIDKKNKVVKEASDTDDGGYGQIKDEMSSDVPTSIIAGPVKNYQDNTWDERNFAERATQIPNAIDIASEGEDVSGFTLH